MSAGAHPSGVGAARDYDGLSIAFLVVASILIGFGLLSSAFFLITFQWIYLAGTLLVVAGGLMLFHPRSGPDSAR